jgi:hypothetical protein
LAKACSMVFEMRCMDIESSLIAAAQHNGFDAIVCGACSP